jgi:hypothetical protein
MAAIFALQHRRYPAQQQNQKVRLGDQLMIDHFPFSFYPFLALLFHLPLSPFSLSL